MTDLTMTDMIVQMIETIRDMDATDVQDAISEAGDLLQSGDRSDDLWTDSVLDGLRWGHRAAGGAFHFKQWGEWSPNDMQGADFFQRVGKKASGRRLDGRTWDQMPVEPTND